MYKPIPFLDLSLIPKEIQMVLGKKFDIMLENGIFSGGEEVALFEQNLITYLGARYAIACANGTDALEVALRALKIGPRDEVIVPALTWVSTAEAVILVGAKPVFVDTDQSGLMDLNLMEELITPHTKAIIPVHLYGKMVDMHKLMTWASQKRIYVIEDNAQGFGAIQNGKRAGNWGDIGCFSFYPTKNLGAIGEAGGITTNHEKLANRIKKWINHGQSTRDHHELVGKNSRIDTIQAGFLNVMFGHYDSFQKKRKELAKIYLKQLKGIGDLNLPIGLLDTSHNCHLFVVQTGYRDGLKSFLMEKEIGTAIHYPGIIPKMRPYFSETQFPVSEKMTQTVLSLPLNPYMDKSQILRVCKAIREFYSKTS
ncbi:DegT/DnrJ/EryC1/StrS family aminotransferase [Aquiflexum sp. TKW24L]|uniref:DegT/DnrJ/EryC1/StrS family aminotransferase n=1 Tax=Aquiflexum sp. TKW24L TaxID=2942212 RepID=UPI0020BDC050|nr:DegT/DnrJ/EryC1/StrS family aminotransferase [Aquiflexum sp. TKW24L]MCL6257618.1 DegT/DnrJ/EryC1/StrS family aminotransferase [Aquiflexum sp. TKW24L]